MGQRRKYCGYHCHRTFCGSGLPNTSSTYPNYRHHLDSSVHGTADTKKQGTDRKMELGPEHLALSTHGGVDHALALAISI